MKFKYYKCILYLSTYSLVYFKRTDGLDPLCCARRRSALAQLPERLLELVGDGPDLGGALGAELGDLLDLVVELVDVVQHGDAAQHHRHRPGEDAAGGVQHQLRNLINTEHILSIIQE